MTATKGLVEIVATESSISSIINDKLTHCGYSLDDLAAKSCFEEVIYLLWNRELPDEKQLAELKASISEEMEIPDALLTHLRSYDLSTVHPMAALRTAISALGMYDEEADAMNKDD